MPRNDRVEVLVAGARKIFILLFNKVETEELIFLNFFNDLVYKQE